jgi:putative ATPase
VQQIVKRSGSLPVPFHIRNAPTRLMKEIGYGKDYKYAHNYNEGYTDQEYLPEKIRGQVFYEPTGRGYEKIIKERLDGWRRLKAKAQQADGKNERFKTK